MDRVRPLISTADLKKLLLSLRQERPDICLRYRLLGELWNTQFMYCTMNITGDFLQFPISATSCSLKLMNHSTGINLTSTTKFNLTRV
jgi:hypothetical protein